MIAKALFPAKTCHPYGVTTFRDHENRPAGYPGRYPCQGACRLRGRRASPCPALPHRDQPPARRPVTRAAQLALKITGDSDRGRLRRSTCALTGWTSSSGVNARSTAAPGLRARSQHRPAIMAAARTCSRIAPVKLHGSSLRAGRCITPPEICGLRRPDAMHRLFPPPSG